jgi:hypothetical protein
MQINMEEFRFRIPTGTALKHLRYPETGEKRGSAVQ